MSLGYRIQELFPGSVVLSDSSTATVEGRSRVLAVQPRGSDTLQLPASPEHPLAAGDRLVVVATQKGLTELSVLAGTRPAA